MANPSEAHKLSIAGIGDKLREAREKKALTVEQVQKQTRIHSTVLFALEEGRADAILAHSYVKSFLKEYANFLGLDSKMLTSSYLASHPEFSEKTSNLTRLEIKPSEASHSGLTRFFVRVLIVAVVIFLAVFFVNKAIVGLKASKGDKKVSVKKPAGVPSHKESARKPDITIKEIPRNQPISLVIKVNRPVMVELKRDGVLLFKRVLPKGAVESLVAKNKINIFVARAESVELVLNGRNLGSCGKGTIRNLEITRTGVTVK